MTRKRASVIGTRDRNLVELRIRTGGKLYEYTAEAETFDDAVAQAVISLCKLSQERRQ